LDKRGVNDVLRLCQQSDNEVPRLIKATVTKVVKRDNQDQGEGNEQIFALSSIHRHTVIPRILGVARTWGEALAATRTRYLKLGTGVLDIFQPHP
jgi:hypothetical protein